MMCMYNVVISFNKRFSQLFQKTELITNSYRGIDNLTTCCNYFVIEPAIPAEYAIKGPVPFRPVFPALKENINQPVFHCSLVKVLNNMDQFQFSHQSCNMVQFCGWYTLRRLLQQTSMLNGEVFQWISSIVSFG